MLPSAQGGEEAVPGGRRDFPSTCWSRIQDAGLGDPAQRLEAVEFLARRYWRPIFAYIRHRWAKSIEDATDLTQDFLLWVIETDFVSRADPARGRFRAFVKTALSNHVMKEARDRHALKRGGDRRILPLDLAVGELEELGRPDPRLASADDVLDRAWRNEVLREAAQRLERSLREEGKEKHFLVFRDSHLSGSPPPGQRALAERHGLSEDGVSNALREAKRRFRAALADVVAETVSSDRDLQEELEALFGGSAP